MLAGADFRGIALVPVSPWLRRTAIALCLLFAGVFLVAAASTFAHAAIGDWRSRAPAAAKPSWPPDVSSSRPSFRPIARVSRWSWILPRGALVQVPRYAEEDNPPRLRYGQRVEIEARFRTPHGFVNPGRIRLRIIPGAAWHLLDGPGPPRRALCAYCPANVALPGEAGSSRCARRRWIGSRSCTRTMRTPLRCSKPS